MLYLVNAFSLNMLQFADQELTISFKPISSNAAQGLLHSSEFKNAIGHPTTDTVIRSQLNIDQAGERMNVLLVDEDQLVVAQYRGPRLGEGATELPHNATIEYYLVTLK